MKTIWKYQIELSDTPSAIQVPENAVIVLIETQNELPVIWFEVETSHSLRERKFAVHGTGHRIPRDGRSHVASFISSPFVWHVYELI